MKKIAWLLSVILCATTFLICPSALAAGTWEIISPYLRFQGGDVSYSASQNPAQWNLNSSFVGERKFTPHIEFKDPYVIPPNVVVSLTGIDGDNTSNSRLTVTPVNVTEKGFDIEYKTWYDTRITSVWSSWTAFGE